MFDRQDYFNKIQKLAQLVTTPETDTTIAKAIAMVKEEKLDIYFVNAFMAQSTLEVAADKGNVGMVRALIENSPPDESSYLLNFSPQMPSFLNEHLTPSSLLFWICDCPDLEKRQALLKMLQRKTEMSDTLRKHITYIQVFQRIYDSHVSAALGDVDTYLVDGEDAFGLTRLDYYALSGYEFSKNKNPLKGYDVNKVLTKGPFKGVSIAWLIAYCGRFEVLKDILELNPKSIKSLNMKVAIKDEQCICAGTDIAMLCLIYKQHDFLISLLNQGLTIDPQAMPTCKNNTGYGKNFIDTLMKGDDPKAIIAVLEAMTLNPDHLKLIDLDHTTNKGHVTAFLIYHNRFDLLRKFIDKTTISISPNSMIYYSTSKGDHVYQSLVVQLAKNDQWETLELLLEKEKNHIIDLSVIVYASVAVNAKRNLEQVLANRNKPLLEKIQKRNALLAPKNNNNLWKKTSAPVKKSKQEKESKTEPTTPIVPNIPKPEPVVVLTPEEILINTVSKTTHGRITLTIEKGKPEDSFIFTATLDHAITDVNKKKEQDKLRRDDLQKLISLFRIQKIKIAESGAFHVKVKAKMNWIEGIFLKNAQFTRTVSDKFPELPKQTAELDNFNDASATTTNSEAPEANPKTAESSETESFSLTPEHKAAWQVALVSVFSSAKEVHYEELPAGSFEITTSSDSIWSLPKQYHMTKEFIEEEIFKRIQRHLTSNKLADVEFSSNPTRFVITPTQAVVNADLTQLKQDVHHQITSRPVVLTADQNLAWKKALNDAVCSANGIIINETNPDEFTLTITEDSVWSVRGPDERHDKSEQFKVTRNDSYSIVAEEIFPRIQRYLENNRLAEVEFNNQLLCLVIKPKSTSIDLKELQVQNYHQISKKPRVTPDKPTNNENTSYITVVETSVTEATTTENDDNCDEVKYPTMLIKGLFNDLAFGPNSNERAFANLDNSNRKIKQGQKWEFIWDLKAYPSIGQFTAKDFFVAMKTVIDPIARGLIETYPTNDGVKIVVALDSKAFAKLAPAMETLHKAFLKEMATLAQKEQDTKNNSVALPRKEVEKPEPQPKPETEIPLGEAMANTIRRSILFLDKIQRDNFSNHLKQLLAIPAPGSAESKPAHFHPYLLHALRLFENLARVNRRPNQQEIANTFDYWRNFIRHAYDKHDWQGFYQLVHKSFEVMKSIDEKTPLPTTGNVTFFMPVTELEKEIVTQLDDAIAPYKDKLKQKQLGKDKSAKQAKKKAQSDHEALLATLSSSDLPANWYRDANIMTHALIGETNTAEPYKDMYIEIGHYGFDQPYDVFADELQQRLQGPVQTSGLS